MKFGAEDRRTLFPPSCNYGSHPYIKSMELDSEDGTFTFNTYADFTKDSMSNCSYGRATCHGLALSSCGYPVITRPIVDIDCKSRIWDCTARYNIQWGCSCKSCPAYTPVAQFSTYYDIVIKPGSCKPNQYWYFYSLYIDSRDGDLFSYKTYYNSSRSDSYAACSSDIPLCSATHRSLV